MNRRELLGSTLALTLAGRPALAEELPVRIGYIADFWGTSIFAIANELKLWAKHNLKPDLKVFTNGPLQVQALGAGSLDFGYIGPGAIWLPASGRAKIVAINAIGFADRVIARPGISSIEALKGKKVGVPEGTSGDMLLRLALGRAKLQLSDFQIIKMDASTAVSAFSSGQIDGAAIWYPLVPRIREHVPDLVEIAKNSDFFPEKTFPSAFVARNEIVADKSATLKAMIALIKEAQDWRAANQTKAAQITAAFLGIEAARVEAELPLGKILSSVELVQLTRDGSVDKWLNGMTDMFVAFGQLSSSQPPSQYYLAAQYTAG